MMHTVISRAYFHAPCKEEKYVELPPEVRSGGCPEYGRLRVSLYGTRDAAANWGGCVRRSTAGTSVRPWGCVSMFILLSCERIQDHGPRR